jgi:hypothetical protein
MFHHNLVLSRLRPELDADAAPCAVGVFGKAFDELRLRA